MNKNIRKIKCPRFYNKEYIITVYVIFQNYVPTSKIPSMPMFKKKKLNVDV